MNNNYRAIHKPTDNIDEMITNIEKNIEKGNFINFLNFIVNIKQLNLQQNEEYIRYITFLGTLFYDKISDMNKYKVVLVQNQESIIYEFLQPKTFTRKMLYVDSFIKLLLSDYHNLFFYKNINNQSLG